MTGRDNPHVPACRAPSVTHFTVRAVLTALAPSLAPSSIAPPARISAVGGGIPPNPHHPFTIKQNEEDMSRKSPRIEPTDDVTQALADIAELRDVARELSLRTEALNLHASHRRAKHIGKQLGVCATNLGSAAKGSTRALATAEAWIELAADDLSTIAVRVGEASHAHA